MADYKSILAYIEASEGKLLPISLEVLGGGKKLAGELGQQLSAVLIGADAGNAAKEAIASGADKVYVVQDASLKDYNTDAYLAEIIKVVLQDMPQIILFGQTAAGRDLAPALAYRLETTAHLDCTALAIDPTSKKMLQTKPVYGGNAQAIYQTNTLPQIASVRTRTQAPLPPDISRQGQIINVDAALDATLVKTKVLNKVKEEVEGIRLEDASVVVAGGRGMGDANGFQQLKELAGILKAAVGASRPACDNGWVPDTRQIGLTGKIVAPNLYIAVGISGASQHLAGCSGSKNIVAVNKDKDANIFKNATFGVVGDWRKVLPAFTAKIKELSG